jgi:hypothetical protein
MLDDGIGRRILLDGLRQNWCANIPVDDRHILDSHPMWIACEQKRDSA